MNRYRIIVPCVSCIVYEVEADNANEAMDKVAKGEAECAEEEECLPDEDRSTWDVDLLE